MAKISTGIWPVDPNVETGTQLATHLAEFVDAFLSMNNDTARPATVQTGGLWTKSTTSGVGNTGVDLFIYDGVTDYKIASIVDGVTYVGNAQTYNTKTSADLASFVGVNVGDWLRTTDTHNLYTWDGSNWVLVSRARPGLSHYSANTTASGTVVITDTDGRNDVHGNSTHEITPIGAVTFDFASLEDGAIVTLILHNGSTQTYTFPANTKWVGAQPSYTTLDMVTVRIVNGIPYAKYEGAIA